MSARRRAGRAGSSLVELLAVTMMMALLGTALFGLFGAFRRQLYADGSVSVLHKNARVALQKMGNDAKEALRVQASHGADATADDVLILRLPSIDAAGEPTDIASDFDYVTYKLDAGDLTRLVRVVDVDAASSRNGGADSTEVVATGVADVYFSEAGTGLSSVGALSAVKELECQIDVQNGQVSGTQTVSLETRFVLRNNI